MGENTNHSQGLIQRTVRGENKKQKNTDREERKIELNEWGEDTYLFFFSYGSTT
jgi:hypothetical protein